MSSDLSKLLGDHFAMVSNMIIKTKKYKPEKRFCVRCKKEMNPYSEEYYQNVCDDCWDRIHKWMYRNYKKA